MENKEKKESVKELFGLWSDDPKINQAARIITGRLIKEYGYEEVKEAFLEAAARSHYVLAYVSGILKKRKENIATKLIRLNVAKEIAESKLLKEDNAGLPGVKEFLESLKKTAIVPEDYTKSDVYQQKKIEFEKALVKGEK